MGDDAPSTQEGRLLSVKERAAMLNAKKATAAASSGPDGGGHVLRSPGFKGHTSASSHDKKPEATPPVAVVDPSGNTHQDPKPTPLSPDASLPRPAEPLIAPNTYALRKPLSPAPPVSCVTPPEPPPLSPSVSASACASASASGCSDPEAPSTAAPSVIDTSLPSPLVISSPVCAGPSLDGSGGSGSVLSSGPKRRSAGLEQRLAALAGAGGEVPLPFSPAMLRAGGGGVALPIMGLRSPGPPQMRRLSGSQGHAHTTADDSAQGAPASLSHSTLARPTLARQRRPRTTPTPLPQPQDNM